MKRLLFSLVLTSIMGCSESVAPHSMIDGSVSNDSGTVITSDSGSDPDSGSEDSGVDSGADTDAGSGCVGPSSPYVHLTAGNSVQLDLTGELVGNVHTVTFWARWPQTNLASIALVFGHGPTLAEDDFLVFGRGTDGRAAVQKAIGFGLESFGDTAAPPNVWHHFALLINTSSGDRTIEWYADGSLVEINEATEQNSMSDIRLTSTLGSASTNNSTSDVTEVAIFDRYLSPSEIRSLACSWPTVTTLSPSVLIDFSTGLSARLPARTFDTTWGTAMVVAQP